MTKHAPPVHKGAPRDPAKEQAWRDILQRYADSGQIARAFGATCGLKETAFYFWRREIPRRDGQRPAPGPRAGSRPGDTPCPSTTSHDLRDRGTGGVTSHSHVV